LHRESAARQTQRLTTLGNARKRRLPLVIYLLLLDVCLSLFIQSAPELAPWDCRREGLAACVARVGLVARVRPKVRRERFSCREGLAACVAREGLDARVHPKMRREIARLRGCLAECVAGVGLVARA
jgi:hypothetical protein